MASFPKSESRIATLAEMVAAGLAGHGEVYPDPPVAPADLAYLLADYADARHAALAAQTTAEMATAAKNDRLAALIAATKRDLRYAENTVRLNDEQLGLLGWSAPRRPSPLAAPGQSQNLTAFEPGEGRLELRWKKPADGGRPSAYRIVRRQQPDGPWQDAAVAVITAIELPAEPRAVELEYRVIAVNRTGEGRPSNTVAVVL